MSNQTPEDSRKRRSTGREKGYTRKTEGPATGKPTEDFRDLGEGQGQKRGGKKKRDNGRCRNVARGAETSGRGRRGAGVDDVQVDGVSRQERRWGVGSRRRQCEKIVGGRGQGRAIYRE